MVSAVGQTRKKEGFRGQKAIIIPRKILAKLCARSEIIGNLYITDIGYYPKAQFHYRERSHGSDQHILIHCFEGYGRLQIRKKEYLVGPGEFCFIPAKEPHIYEADRVNPWTIYWTHFKGNVAGAIINKFGQHFDGYKGSMRNSAAAINLFNEIYHQLERGYGGDNLGYANMCLWHYLTRFLFSGLLGISAKTGVNDYTSRAIDFLKKNTDRTLTLEEISASVNLSASHFSYIFKNKTGFSPIEYFNHLKVQRACQYLLFTDLRIKEISVELGIDDPYYFSRMFKKIMGLSPGEYREKRVH